jgi:hypothetical protein
MKKAGMKKMMTGGMKNSNTSPDGVGLNAAGVRGRKPGSQGVGTTRSEKPTVPTRAGGTSSGGVNKVPTSAIPSKSNSKMYGGKMKMGGMKKGGAKKK